MAELTISSDEIRSAIASYVSSLETETSREEVGTVADTGDGIAHVEGLPSAMTNELLEFEGGVLGVALNLDVRETQEAAIRLYESLGYVRWGINPDYAQVRGKIIRGFYYSKRLRARRGQSQD